MWPQQGRDAHVDAIDLTLSSPEPDTRPHAHVDKHVQQQQPARALKQEPGNPNRVKHNTNRRQGSTSSGNVSQQHSRRIDPHHVKQIIDTSSSQSLRHVVLQLCKSSPALSGAIARGLAPHSPWAQALIRGHHAQAKAQTQRPLKSEPRSNERAGNEDTQKHSGQSNTTHDAFVKVPRRVPAATSDYHRPTAVCQYLDSLRLPPSSQRPIVKREHQSPTDSDDSTNIVHFPAVGREPQGQEPFYRAAASSSSRHRSSADLGAGRLVVRQRSQDRDAPPQKPQLCVRCDELFKEGDMNCYYHHGFEAPSRPDIVPQYTCCGKFIGEPGCTFGRHTSTRTGALTNSKRPSPSPYGGSQWSKKPRVL